MNKTLAKIMAAGTLAAVLTASMPAAAVAAEVTTVSENTLLSQKSTAKKMYVKKTCYSYKKANTKSAKVKKYSKGTEISVVSEDKSFYKLADGSYILKSRVGAKRVNWTVTKLKKPLTRYVSKNGTKIRSSALSNGKVADTLSKGTEVKLVGKTNSGFYQLEDGNFIKTSAVEKFPSKPAPDSGSFGDSQKDEPYQKPAPDSGSFGDSQKDEPYQKPAPDSSSFYEFQEVQLLLTVNMPNGVYVSDQFGAHMSPRDFSFTLTTADGVTFDGSVEGGTGDMLYVTFNDVGSISAVMGAKVSFSNNFSLPLFEGDTWKPTFEDTNTQTLILTQDNVFDQQVFTVPTKNLTQAYLDYCKKEDPGYDPMEYEEVRIRKEDAIKFGISIPVDTLSVYAKLQSNDTGVGAGTIKDVPIDVWYDVPNGALSAEVESLKSVRDITDIYVYCDDVMVCHTYPNELGIFYYTLPLKPTEDLFPSYIPAGDISFEFVGYDRTVGVRKFSGKTKSDFLFQYPAVWENNFLVVGRDFNIKYE